MAKTFGFVNGICRTRIGDSMARSDRAQEYVEWKEGAIVFGIMLVAAILGGVAGYLLDVAFAWLIGGFLGAVIVFLGYSYLRYGR